VHAHVSNACEYSMLQVQQPCTCRHVVQILHARAPAATLPLQCLKADVRLCVTSAPLATWFQRQLHEQSHVMLVLQGRDAAAEPQRAGRHDHAVPRQLPWRPGAPHRGAPFTRAFFTQSTVLWTQVTASV